MALDPVSLKALIASEMIAIAGVPTDPTKLNDFCEAIANAVVTHINASAEVVVGVGSSAGTYGVD